MFRSAQVGNVLLVVQCQLSVSKQPNRYIFVHVHKGGTKLFPAELVLAKFEITKFLYFYNLDFPSEFL